MRQIAVFVGKTVAFGCILIALVVAGIVGPLDEKESKTT